MDDGGHVIANVQAALDAGHDYRVELQAGVHRLVADEPPVRGGADAGAAPYALLLSGLAACTAITLRMVAKRKGWPLAGVGVDARLLRGSGQAHIERTLTLNGSLEPEQVERLLEVAEKTPVTLTLKGGIEIRTRLG